MSRAASAGKARFWVVCADGYVSGPWMSQEVAEAQQAAFPCQYEHEIVESATKPETRKDDKE